LRRQGLCEFIGLTGLGDPAALAEVVDSSRFDVAQIYYNLLNPTALGSAGPGWNTTDFNGLLRRCAAQDMGVMGIRIFAAGHLATTERHGREVAITANAENAVEEARAKAALALIGRQHGTPAQAALRFGLGCPLLSTIEVGIGETWHLDEALAAVEMGPLPAPLLEALEKLRATDPAFRR
jgi:L-galactose dehydrogenase/L-glyceraldehyde 3-phosphate reductase